MQAIILAAGKGSRLKHLTADRPKPLVAVKGIPMLGRTITSLLKIPEITEIIIMTGHMSQNINNYIQDNFPSSKIKLVFNDNYQAGTVITVCKAEQAINNNFLLLNADHLFSYKAYQRLIQQSTESNLTFSSFRDRKPLDNETKISLNLDNSFEMSKNLENYDCGYPGLAVVSKEYIPEFFEEARKFIESDGEAVFLEQLLAIISKKTTTRECDISDLSFIKVDTPDDHSYAESKIVDLELEEEEKVYENGKNTYN